MAEPESPWRSSDAPIGRAPANLPPPLTTIHGSTVFDGRRVRVHLSGFGRLWVLVEQQAPVTAWARLQPATWIALPALGQGIRLRYSNYWLWYDARLCDAKGRALTGNLLLRGSIVLYAILVCAVALLALLWIWVRR